ncbi:MAG: hypothetical protein H0V30_01730 [Chitinophagaceae bacterium]|jgi:hypothetical protein|nr:hypothetical protein [Chitinophagaceae bacterium]
MDLNNIKLTATMISGLYTDQLIEEKPDIIPMITKSQMTAGIKFLGDNKKNILILINNPDTVFLPDEQLNFLTTILNACKMSLGDVAIINLAHTQIDYQTLKKNLNQDKALLFDIQPAQIQLPVKFPHFQVQSFDGCQYLLSPSLDQLDKDKQLKGKLWSCLQRLFLS